MKSHELAKYLLSEPDMKVECSMDVSTCDEDAFDRIFGELFEAVAHKKDFMMLCFNKSVKNYD